MTVKLHQYEAWLWEHEKLTHCVRPVEPQPDFRHNELLDADGMLLICDGDHPKSTGCDYKPWQKSPFAEQPPFNNLRVLEVSVRRVYEFLDEDYLAFGIQKWVPKGDDAIVCGPEPAYRYPGQGNFIGGWSPRNSWIRMWAKVFPKYPWRRELMVWVAELQPIDWSKEKKDDHREAHGA
jgi:hypothetical protein